MLHYDNENLGKYVYYCHKDNVTDKCKISFMQYMPVYICLILRIFEEFKF